MTRTGEVRTIDAQMALPGLGAGHRGRRGGGSARPGPLAPRGGGYPDFCDAREVPVSDDPRLRELRLLDRLSPTWLRIAEEIGVEAFVRMWRLLIQEHEQPVGGARDQVRVYVPSFEWWKIAERNAQIRYLAELGHSPPQIVSLLAQQGLQISERHVSRVLDQ